MNYGQSAQWKRIAGRTRARSASWLLKREYRRRMRAWELIAPPSVMTQSEFMRRAGLVAHDPATGKSLN